MDDSAHRNKPDSETPTPEVAQLLKMLDLQTTGLRQSRAKLHKTLQGDSFRYGSLVLIVVFALGSVAVMEWMLSQLPKPAHASAGASPGALSAPSGTAISKN